MRYVMQPYDDALAYILAEGVEKSDRTGTGTLSVSGLQCRYRLDGRFPLVTRRKVWPKSIFAELLWVLEGSTNINRLNELGSKIWDAWRSSEFEGRLGYAEGALGPIYGFSLRHFGGEYGDGESAWIDQIDARGETFYGRVPSGFRGYDQLQYVCREIESNPSSRRILFNLWNPRQLGDMRLPPCHYSFQIVITGGRMTGILTMRSGDFGCGCNANAQFYATLTMMFAQQFGYTAYELVQNVGDAHIYLNQIDAVKQYLASPVIDSPRLILHKAKDIFSYQLSDFEVVDYNPGPAIKMPVAV